MRHAAAVLAGVAALLAPASALAKGPVEASIDGPGLGSPLTFGGDGGAVLAPGAPLMELAEATGFFPAAFGQAPDPMLPRRPAGDLGPRYVIAYRVPGPGGEDVILQDLYPYAKPVAVTYMKPGQRLFEAETTRGGWFATTNADGRPLLGALVAAGLPRTPPGGDDSPLPWAALVLGCVVSALLAFAGVAIVRTRRRPEPAL